MTKTQTQPPTHLVLDVRDRVAGAAYGNETAWSLALQVAANTGRTAQVVELATADVATLARIARTDNPKLTNTGSGMFATGAHPAAPYLEAMQFFSSVVDTESAAAMHYGAESALNIVRGFLVNVGTWRGETARLVKARLKQIVGA